MDEGAAAAARAQQEALLGQVRGQLAAAQEELQAALAQAQIKCAKCLMDLPSPLTLPCSASNILRAVFNVRAPGMTIHCLPCCSPRCTPQRSGTGFDSCTSGGELGFSI